VTRLKESIRIILFAGILPEDVRNSVNVPDNKYKSTGLLFSRCIADILPLTELVELPESIVVSKEPLYKYLSKAEVFVELS
jgi:hypothetical protein